MTLTTIIQYLTVGFRNNGRTILLFIVKPGSASGKGLCDLFRRDLENLYNTKRFHYNSFSPFWGSQDKGIDYG